MVNTGSWQGYLDNFAAVAGTLFALVIAARGLVIGIGHSPGATKHSERRYLLWDSVSSTYELAAAALLAVFAGMPAKAYWFLAMLPLFIAVLGVGLVVGTWVCVALAWRQLNGKARLGALFQALACFLPTACYVASFRIWLTDAFHVWEWPPRWMAPEDALALAISWLTVSGTLQTIWWYRKTWVAQLT